MSDIGLLIVGILTLGVQWCFYIPYCVYNLWKFRSHVLRRRARLLKRHPNITMGAVAIGIVWLAMYTMVVLSTFFDGLSFLRSIFAAISIIFNFSFSYTILCRVWLAYFQINYHFSSSQRQWQQYIHQKALKQDWFMLNLQTYGNVNYCLKRTVAAIVAAIVLFYVCALWSILFFIQFLVYILPWVLMAVLYYKMPRFNDDIAIRSEVKYILIMYSISVLSELIILIVLIYSNDNGNTVLTVLSAILIHVFMFVLFSICNIMTYWVLVYLNIVKSKYNNKGKSIFTFRFTNKYDDLEYSQSYNSIDEPSFSYTQWFRSIKERRKKSKDESKKNNNNTDENSIVPTKSPTHSNTESMSMVDEKIDELIDYFSQTWVNNNGYDADANENENEDPEDDIIATRELEAFSQIADQPPVIQTKKTLSLPTASPSVTSTVGSKKTSDIDGTTMISDVNSKEVKITLQMMFAKMKFFNKLMIHLQQEFSPELLLFIIEVVQAQVMMLMHMHKYKNFYRKQYSDLNVKSNIQLPKGMPKSAIVWGNYDSLIDKNIAKYNKSGKIVSEYQRKQILFRLVLFQLYKRYIKPYSAEFEINIASGMRKKLVAVMDNYEIWMSDDYGMSVMNAAALVNLFEPCKQSQFRLLLAAFARYKGKAEFNSIQEYYGNKFALMQKKRRKEDKLQKQRQKQSGKYDKLDNENDTKDGGGGGDDESNGKEIVMDTDEVKETGLVMIDGVTPNYDDEEEEEEIGNGKQSLMKATNASPAVVQSDSERKGPSSP